ncbi:uncharacterized protein [Hyperolius riggenbachi]|uniref:uncharacterized protein isoform X1 n=1 Tax=Hyperolius riggenbachi TaxID=752182 RepID=UPI0035A33509
MARIPLPVQETRSQEIVKEVHPKKYGDGSSAAAQPPKSLEDFPPKRLWSNYSSVEVIKERPTEAEPDTVQEKSILQTTEEEETDKTNPENSVEEKDQKSKEDKTGNAKKRRSNQKKRHSEKHKHSEINLVDDNNAKHVVLSPGVSSGRSGTFTTLFLLTGLCMAVTQTSAASLFTGTWHAYSFHTNASLDDVILGITQGLRSVCEILPQISPNTRPCKHIHVSLINKSFLLLVTQLKHDDYYLEYGHMMTLRGTYEGSFSDEKSALEKFVHREDVPTQRVAPTQNTDVQDNNTIRNAWWMLTLIILGVLTGIAIVVAMVALLVRNRLCPKNHQQQPQDPLALQPLNGSPGGGEP